MANYKKKPNCQQLHFNSCIKARMIPNANSQTMGIADFKKPFYLILDAQPGGHHFRNVL